MHVLILASWYRSPQSPWKGRFFLEQGRALAEQGIEVRLVSAVTRSLLTLKSDRLPRPLFRPLMVDTDNVPQLVSYGYAVPKMRGVRDKVYQWRTRNLLDHYIRRFGTPDIVHAHGSYRAGRAAAQFCATSNVPYVVTEHAGDLLNLPKCTNRFVSNTELGFRQASAVIAVSSGLAESLKPICNQEILVIPNTVDQTVFLCTNRITSTPFRFITVGNLVKSKRIDLLLRSFEHAFSDNPDVSLSVIGQGPELSALKELQKSLNSRNRISFDGPMEKGEVAKSMQRSHAYVSASAHESFGVSIIEALASGLPVIATDSIGPRDILRPTDGLLVKSGTVESLAQAMLEIYGTIAMYDSKQISESAAQRFGYESVAKRLMSVYAEVLDKKGA